MKKAKVVLFATLLFALVGGALAFKAARFTNVAVKTYTSVYSIGGIAYYAPTSYCFPSQLFVTPGGTSPLVNVHTTLTNAATKTVEITNELGQTAILTVATTCAPSFTRTTLAI